MGKDSLRSMRSKILIFEPRRIAAFLLNGGKKAFKSEVDSFRFLSLNWSISWCTSDWIAGGMEALGIITSLIQIGVRWNQKGTFGFACELPIIVHGQFIFLIAVRIERKTPFVITEITQAAKVDGSIAQTLGILFAGFRPICRRPSIGENRFGICVNIAKLILETNFKARVLAFEFLLCDRADTFLHIRLDDRRDFYAA
jgi:hypothetical protein